MNHCIDCGHHISRGRVLYAGSEVRCELCKVKRVMTTFRYVSPAIKRRIKKEQEDGTHDHEHRGTSILKRHRG